MAATRQVISFAIVGVAGLAVDVIALYAFLGLGAGYWLGRLGSFLLAASFTWMLNRRVTFDGTTADPMRQWLNYLMVNVVGGVLNLGVYGALIVTSDVVRSAPVLGVAAGSMSGALWNFVLSQRLVFRS